MQVPTLKRIYFVSSTDSFIKEFLKTFETPTLKNNKTALRAC